MVIPFPDAETTTVSHHWYSDRFVSKQAAHSEAKDNFPPSSRRWASTAWRAPEKGPFDIGPGTDVVAA